MLETLTGAGLASSAGLNAYVPLLMIGLLARLTDLVELPASWQWLGNGWVISILVVLLAVELVADKVPVVDHLNDVVQTVVRPTAGGLAFGAASGSQTVTVDDPAEFFGSHQWVPVAVGIVIALAVHGVKATARPVVNAGTGGLGAPVVSAVEDVTSVVVAIVAIVVPVLVLVFGIMIAWFGWRVARRRRHRRARAGVRTP